MLADPKDPAFVGALVHFEKAAEHLSFSAAADALGVTPSAVSHRIAALETALGKRLFIRETRRVRLTREGVDLARTTASALAEIRAATARIAQSRAVRVSVGYYLSSTWLMPRIADFEASHPGVRIDLAHAPTARSVRDCDVTIAWVDAEPRDRGGFDLFDLRAVPVGAPGLAVGADFWTGPVPPIHYRDRRSWRHWLRRTGAPEGFADRGEVLDDPGLVLEAAVHGRGLAIGYDPLIAPQLAAGRLVALSAAAVSPERTYHVRAGADDPLTAAFLGWLRAQASATDRALKEPQPERGRRRARRRS
jgi:LysR family glycine cleavage system transcriptional activator